MTTGRAVTDRLRDQSRLLLSILADLRASQQGYVAVGQGERFWMERMSSLLPALERQLADFRGALATPAAQSAIASAVNAAENLRKLDARVRDYVLGGETLVASDLIFSDGLEAAEVISTGIETALGQELQARGTALAEARRGQTIVLAVGSGLIFLFVLVLALAGQSGQPTAADEPQAAQATEAAAPGTPASPADFDQADLTNAAWLCTDLAKVVETAQMPRLLERIAGIMDATGVVVWVADPSGRELRPAMSHGYSDQLLARMGTIGRDATNATAAAYRTGKLRAVPGDGIGNGAIAVPLLAADGCIGVLSLEVRSGGEHSSTTRSLATIFAAQLATLVTVPSAPAQQTAVQA
jgi:CHASE3 domain sensor protein